MALCVARIFPEASGVGDVSIPTPDVTCHGVPPDVGAHASNLAELDPEDGAELFRVCQRAAEALRSSTLRCEGANLFLADGEAAGQDVFHVHLHVIPRHADDGFGLRLPDDYSIRPRAELDETAAALRGSWSPASRQSSTSNSS